MLLTGRQVIYTSLLPEGMNDNFNSADVLDETTLPKELERAMLIHTQNAVEIEYLINFYKGKQQILERSDEDRKVNNKVVLNYAQAATRDIVGYTYGKPLQYVQRDNKFMPDIQTLNDYVGAENKFMLDKMMADDQSICGTAYRGVFPDSKPEKDAPFELLYLNPLTTFVVYSVFNPTKAAYACTYFDINKGTMIMPNWERIYQVYTYNKTYTFKSAGNLLSAGIENTNITSHILNDVPIVEYPNNQWRLGDWECSVSLMNALNNLASDSVNDVEQTVLSFLALFGVEPPTDEEWLKMKENRILVFKGVPGINQDAKFITAQIDGSSAQLLRTYLEEAFRSIVGIPDRKTRGGGGGDTGDAVKLRDGWADIEIVARNKEMFTSTAEKNVLRIILNILKIKEKINPNLTLFDIDIKFSRNKTDNLLSKAQAASTLYGINMSKTDIADLIDLTNDNVGLIKRWIEEEKSKKDAKNKGNKESTTAEGDIIIDESKNDKTD